MTGGLWRARLHALFDRRRACQRPCQAGGIRQGVGRPAAALRLRHDDRPGHRRGADEHRCGPESLFLATALRAYRCSPPTRCCASAAARRCRAATAEAFKTLPSERGGRRRRRCGSIRAPSRPTAEWPADRCTDQSCDSPVLPHKEGMISSDAFMAIADPNRRYLLEELGAARRRSTSLPPACRCRGRRCRSI